MARRRFFVDTVRDGSAELTGEDAIHLARVLRAEAGQQFELSDDRSIWLAEVATVEKHCVRFRILAAVPPAPPSVRVILLASLIKFDRFEWVVEKATELGVDTIIPVNAQRSEKGLEAAAVKRTERWRKIARESSQQARRDRLPAIRAPRSLPAALAEAATYRFCLEETPGARGLIESLPPARTASDSVALLVGPEGGWTDQERPLLAGSGFAAVSLGPQILRAETAAIAALAILRHAWQALR